MKIRMNRKLIAGLAAMGAAGLTAGLLATSAGSAAAEAKLDLTYSCPFPVIDTQQIAVHIDASIPDTIEVNKPTGAFDIVAITTLNEDTRAGLKLIKGASIDGTAVSSAHITAPGMDTDLDVDVVIEKTAVPTTAGAPFIVKATGKTPSLTFKQAGPIKITVGSLVMNVKVYKTDGTLASVPNSTNPFEVPCAMDPGQNNVLKEGEILPGSGETTTSTTTTTTSPTTTESTTTTEPTSSTTTESTTATTTESSTTTTEPTTTESSTTTTESSTTATEPTSTTTESSTTTTESSTSATSATSTTTPVSTSTEPTKTTTPTTTTTTPTSTTTKTSATTPTTTTTTSKSSTTAPTTTTTTSPTTTTTEPVTTTEETTTTVPYVNTTVPTYNYNPPAYASSSSSGDLADTGVSVWWPLGIGVSMIGLGITALYVLRLRTRRRS